MLQDMEPRNLPMTGHSTGLYPITNLTHKQFLGPQRFRNMLTPKPNTIQPSNPELSNI